MSCAECDNAIFFIKDISAINIDAALDIGELGMSCARSRRFVENRAGIGFAFIDSCKIMISFFVSLVICRRAAGNPFGNFVVVIENISGERELIILGLCFESNLRSAECRVANRNDVVGIVNRNSLNKFAFAVIRAEFPADKFKCRGKSRDSRYCRRWSA